MPSSLVPQQQWDTDAVWTIPNVISFVRLLGIPAFCWLIVIGNDLGAIILLVVFGATDWVDGFVARRLKQRTQLGARLDPIADRLYILATVAALMFRGLVPWWFVMILFARDVMLACLLPILKRHGLVSLPVNYVGKLGTLLLLLALPLILLGGHSSIGWPAAHWIGWFLGVAGALAYWAAGLLYVRETLHLAKDR